MKLQRLKHNDLLIFAHSKICVLNSCRYTGIMIANDGSYFIIKFSIFIQYFFQYTYFVNFDYFNDGEVTVTRVLA